MFDCGIPYMKYDIRRATEHLVRKLIFDTAFHILMKEEKYGQNQVVLS